MCVQKLCCCFLVTVEHFLGSDFRLKQLCNLKDICYQVYRKAIDLYFLTVGSMPERKAMSYLAASLSVINFLKFQFK